MAMTRRRDPDSDRLATAVFAAALLHGLVILGVRFVAPPRADDPLLTTVEVLLVPAGADERLPNADAGYIAQRTQRGTGAGPQRRRTSLPEMRAPLDDSQRYSVTADRPPSPPREAPGRTSTLARHALEARRLPDGTELRPQPSSDAAAERPLPPLGLNAAATDRELRLRGKPGLDDRLLANTRESAIAAYLDGWKRRIERAGTLNFPNEAHRRRLSGNPVLEVAIHADGRLADVIVRRTSGHRELDNAAVGIVRLAAPFDPFPTAVRERFPLLRFAYEWQFLKGRVAGDGSVFTTGQ